MSITSMAGRLITVHRRTAFALDSAVATATMSLDRQPPVASVIEIEVSAGAGTVTVTGTVAGVPDSEVLTYAAGGTQRTIKLFTAVDALGLAVSAGLVGATIQALALGGDGSRNHMAYVLITGVRAHLNRGSARWPNTVAGTAEVERTWFGIDYTTLWAPREGDVFVDQGSSEQWKVVGTPDWLGSIRPHHWEVRVVRNEGALST